MSTYAGIEQLDAGPYATVAYRTTGFLKTKGVGRLPFEDRKNRVFPEIINYHFCSGYLVIITTPESFYSFDPSNK
jgi:hypothetical protein